MSKEKKTLRVITTLKTEHVKLIDDAVETGEYSSRGHWLKRAAIAMLNGKAG